MTMQNTTRLSAAMAAVFVAAILLVPPVPISAEPPEKTQEELEVIFGKDLTLAEAYHEKDIEVKEYDEKEETEKLDEDEKAAHIEAKIDRALHLGKLNAKGYVSTEQLMKDIEEGTQSFDTIFPEEASEATATIATSDGQYAPVTQVCDCPDGPHVQFVTGYVHYTWWGLWKNTVTDHDYDFISSSERFGDSTTLVEDDYTTKIYPHTKYRLAGGATSASFQLDYQTTDAGQPPNIIVSEEDISITNAKSWWKTYWHTAVPEGLSQAGGEVRVDAFLRSIS